MRLMLVLDFAGIGAGGCLEETMDQFTAGDKWVPVLALIVRNDRPDFAGSSYVGVSQRRERRRADGRSIHQSYDGRVTSAIEDFL